MNTSDHELIAESRAGRTEAFGRLVLRYQDRLFHALWTILGSADDARDVSQDAFLLAFEKLDSFRGQSAFYSWLFRIALNSSVNHHRKSRPTTSLDAARDAGGHEPADGRADLQPAYPLEQLERQALVRSALAELSEEYRTCLVLKEIDGLKYEEIAEIVQCPIGTVRSRIHRARCELRERLATVLEERSPKREETRQG